MWDELTRDRYGVGGVIAVAVRDQHHIERAELLRRLRTGRIARHPRIEHDALAAGRLQEKRRVAQPRN